MLSNKNKTVPCNDCGSVMRSDNLKRHMITKHGTSGEVVQHEEDRRPQKDKAIQTDTHANDVDGYSTIEKGSTDTRFRNTEKKQFVLLPEEKHRHAVEAAAYASMLLAEANNNRNVLQSFQHHEQREMLKRFRLAMHNTLRDAGSDHVNETKMSAYRETMNDFA